jgi:hypothetical protein
MVRFLIVPCPCFRLVQLDRRNARKILGAAGAAFIVYGGVCDSCGRGLDVKIERQPGNRVRRG